MIAWAVRISDSIRDRWFQTGWLLWLLFSLLLICSFFGRFQNRALNHSVPVLLLIPPSPDLGSTGLGLVATQSIPSGEIGSGLRAGFGLMRV